MLESLDFIVSELQKCAITQAMPPVTVSQRVRAKLFALFRDQRFNFSKTGLAAYCQKPLPWLSNFLHPNANRTLRPSFHLDELDDIAGYFRISLGELLGAPKTGELSGDETRVLLAFRVLPPALQEHVLRILEPLSLVSRVPLKQSLHPPAALAQNAQTEASHGRPLPPHDADARTLINEAMVLLGHAAAATGLDRPLSSPRPEKSAPGSVAR